MTSDRTMFRRRWHPDLMGVDTVLDVEQIARRTPRLGRHVTLARFPGGLHDLVLSPKPVREAVFAEMKAWLRYLDATDRTAERRTGQASRL
jgi:alpha-beta hydrolase superfamily lysophospholipase